MTRAAKVSRSKLAAYIQLVHPGPVLIVLVATVVLGYVIDSGASTGTRITMFVSMLGAQIVIGVVNDLADRDIDRVMKPEKPFSSGRVMARGATVLLTSGLALLIAGALRLNWMSVLLATFGCGVGISYSLWFKRTLLAWVPYVVALPLLPIWISVATGRFRPELLTAYPIGFCAVAGVQLAQSVSDVARDREVEIRSLTTILGERRTSRLCWASVAISALLLAIVGRSEPVAVAASVVVMLGTSGNAVLYRVRRTFGLKLIFPMTAIGTTILGAAWLYAIGT